MNFVASWLSAVGGRDHPEARLELGLELRLELELEKNKRRASEQGRAGGGLRRARGPAGAGMFPSAV